MLAHKEREGLHTMSDLAQSFLERWTEENVVAVPASEVESEAERLATACKNEAAQEGISDDELDEACAQSSDDEYPDISSFMQAALENAAAGDDDDSYADDDEDEDS
jgi:FKBP-type peptidyl-prolyl cis-trans isomerase (trigger factor)